MTNKRNKVASTSVDDGHALVKSYSDPALGPQHLTGEYDYDMRNLNSTTLLNLAPYAFLAIAGTRYQREPGHPDVGKITQELYDEMVAGNWQPSKRDTSASEPTDLMRALAELKGMPVHVIQHYFETDILTVNHTSSSQDPSAALFRDKAGKTRRFFNVKVQREIAADPAVAPIIARLEQERAKATLAALKGSKQPSRLTSLFTMPAAEVAQNEPAEAAQ